MGGGGPQCRMSILRNGNIACLFHLFFSMSHVEFKKRPCPMSLYFYPSCRMSLSAMSHVEFNNVHVSLSILGVKGHFRHNWLLKKLPGFSKISQRI